MIRLLKNYLGVFLFVDYTYLIPQNKKNVRTKLASLFSKNGKFSKARMKGTLTEDEFEIDSVPFILLLSTPGTASGITGRIEEVSKNSTRIVLTTVPGYYYPLTYLGMTVSGIALLWIGIGDNNHELMLGGGALLIVSNTILRWFAAFGQRGMKDVFEEAMDISLKQ